jgi:N-carbamoyl-L-amino-acid hydrolase
MAARRWLVARMTAAGLAAELDGIGNILGRSPASGPRLLVGSHSDSQNHAGWLDGAMGVIFGLEIARSFLEKGLPGAVDCVVWSDEEAHFASFLGSRSAVGQLDESEIAEARDATTGLPLITALERAGLAELPRQRLPVGDYIGYLEAHIEQGATLEDNGLALGIVTGIVGIYQYRITLHGERNHAGTTSMARRRDASRALIALAARIDAHLSAHAASDTVWTIGSIRVEPGQVSIIPDLAEMHLQLRDVDPAVLDRLDADIRRITVEAGPTCRATLEMTARTEPSIMAEPLRNALATAAGRLAPGGWTMMPSGAGHDAQILAGVMPAGMLFVPSIGGISHHWTEDTAETDIILGCETLAEACRSLLDPNR